MRERKARWKVAGKCILAAIFEVAGVGHFAATDSFVKVMPSYLPFHREAVLVSGVIEIVLGVLLLVPKTSRMAAWGLVALLVAVFPANVNIYLHQELFPTFPYSNLLHLLRLPLQGALIYWAYSFTKGKDDQRSEPRPSGENVA